MTLEVLAKSRVEIRNLKSILILGPQKFRSNTLNILVKHCFECYVGMIKYALNMTFKTYMKQQFISTFTVCFKDISVKFQLAAYAVLVKPELKLRTG